jgi:hypothetical protein
MHRQPDAELEFDPWQHALEIASRRAKATWQMPIPNPARIAISWAMSLSVLKAK